MNGRAALFAINLPSNIFAFCRFNSCFFVRSTTPKRANEKPGTLDFSRFSGPWWGKMDSNHRRQCQQIYSLSPLATREFPHILDCLFHPVRFVRPFGFAAELCAAGVGGAGRRTRTPDLLITNQLLYQLSYTSTARTSMDNYSGKGAVCQEIFLLFRKFFSLSGENL